RGCGRRVVCGAGDGWVGCLAGKLLLPSRRRRTGCGRGGSWEVGPSVLGSDGLLARSELLGPGFRREDGGAGKTVLAGMTEGAWKSGRAACRERGQVSGGAGCGGSRMGTGRRRAWGARTGRERRWRRDRE